MNFLQGLFLAFLVAGVQSQDYSKCSIAGDKGMEVDVNEQLGKVQWDMLLWSKDGSSFGSILTGESGAKMVNCPSFTIKQTDDKLQLTLTGQVDDEDKSVTVEGVIYDGDYWAMHFKTQIDGKEMEAGMIVLGTDGAEWLVVNMCIPDLGTSDVWVLAEASSDVPNNFVNEVIPALDKAGIDQDSLNAASCTK